MSLSEPVPCSELHDADISEIAPLLKREIPGKREAKDSSHSPDRCFAARAVPQLSAAVNGPPRFYQVPW
jgi:hypothetical protein